MLLTREPEIGMKLSPNSRVWFLAMAPIGETQVSLYYTFDEQTVRFLSIREI